MDFGGNFSINTARKNLKLTKCLTSLVETKNRKVSFDLQRLRGISTKCIAIGNLHVKGCTLSNLQR